MLYWNEGGNKNTKCVGPRNEGLQSRRQAKEIPKMVMGHRRIVAVQQA